MVAHVHQVARQREGTVPPTQKGRQEHGPLDLVWNAETLTPLPVREADCAKSSLHLIDSLAAVVEIPG